MNPDLERALEQAQNEDDLYWYELQQAEETWRDLWQRMKDERDHYDPCYEEVTA